MDGRSFEDMKKHKDIKTKVTKKFLFFMIVYLYELLI